MLISGATAAARGAYEAGAGLYITYPGSPVVETFEVLRSKGSPAASKCRLAINEHVAYHTALGYSLSGGRSFVIMKHVGLNVASDPAHYSAYTGVRGGMVILVGHDPGATCSTGEFDARLLSLHTNLPILEPGNFQETLDFTREAFIMSEKVSLPIMVFIPSSLCYGMGLVFPGAVIPSLPPSGFVKDRGLTCVGPMAVERHRLLADRIRNLAQWRTPESSEDPEVFHDRDKSVPARPFPDGRLAILRSDASISDGVSFPEARVDVGNLSSADSGEGGGILIVSPGPLFHMVAEIAEGLGDTEIRGVYSPAMTFPLNEPDFIEALNSTGAKQLLLVEELEGLLELQIARLSMNRGLRFSRFAGKEIFPPFGSLGAAEILSGLKRFLGTSGRVIEETDNGDAAAGQQVSESPLAAREGTFCPGCPHRAFFQVLLKNIGDGIIGGDIGCSSLPPHYSDWLTCMNSGASIASGVTLAEGEAHCATPLPTRTSGRRKVVSLIGDSTLLHSGLQTVAELAAIDSEQVLFVLDNRWTAMTGHQETLSTPRDVEGRLNETALDIRSILEALGVRKIVEADPFRLSNLGRVMRKAFDTKGFSVVLIQAECRLQQGRRVRNPKVSEKFTIVPERCRRCDQCYSGLTCPAIGPGFDEETLFLDPELCAGCSVCRQVCPNGGIASMAVCRPHSGGEETK